MFVVCSFFGLCDGDVTGDGVISWERGVAPEWTDVVLTFSIPPIPASSDKREKGVTH